MWSEKCLFFFLYDNFFQYKRVPGMAKKFIHRRVLLENYKHTTQKRKTKNINTRQNKQIRTERNNNKKVRQNPKE